MKTNLTEAGFFHGIVLSFVLMALALTLTGCDKEQATRTDQAAQTAEVVSAEKETVSAEGKDTETPVSEAAPTDKSKPSSGEIMSENSVIKMETSMGTITIELDAQKAPKTVENFVNYAKDGFYDGLIFHRVIPNFMIQGGGMLPDMSEKSNNSPIKNEANNGLKNDRGTIAMARTNDPHSATSQFFINLKDNDFLNFTSETPAGWGYAVFGKVTDGLEVIDEIAKVKTGNYGHHGDVPLEPVLINKVTVE